MSSVTTKPGMVLGKEKDLLTIDGDVQIKQEIDELDDFKASTKYGDNGIIIKQEIEVPCDCMQNVQYYCNKCEKVMKRISKEKQCPICSETLKLQCRLCQKRYKLLRSGRNISTDLEKKDDIKDQENFVRSMSDLQTTDKRVINGQLPTRNENESLAISETGNEGLIFCYKCDFSTKLKQQLNYHILKTHWQPKSEVINCDDDMYIELLCKKCTKICRKVAYNNSVKLVCRECQIPMLYRCTLCCNSYKLLKNVRSHVKSVCPYRTDNQKFYCADCTFKTETKLKLEDHIVKKHLKQECLECHEILENNDALIEHKLQHCQAKTRNIRTPIELPYKNPTEEERRFVIVEYRSKDLLKGLKGKTPKDIKDWGSLVDYLCLKCGDEAKKKFARYRPWCRTCNVKYDYRCITCEKLYGNYERILYHVQTGCPDRMVFQCPLCKFEVPRKSFLSSHLQSEHTIYKCMRCFVNVEGYTALKKHQSTDCCKDHPCSASELEKLISLYCKECCKQLRRAAGQCGKCSSILSHQCLRCLNVFDNKDFAYKHIKESCKPNFQCDQCTFKTYTKEGLVIHTKYKHIKLVCSDCGIHFKDKLIFQLHIQEEMRRKRRNLGAIPTPNSKRLKAS